MLSFINDNEQADYLIEDGLIETDGITLWYINEHGRFESITTANLVDFLIADNKVKEVINEEA